jgi:hypothetical protein
MESKESPEVNTNSISKFWNIGVLEKIIAGALAAVALSGVAAAQDKKDEITFNLIPNPAVIDCLRANSYEEPQAKATVIRGKLNDTLILDLDGIKPGLAFDLFTVQHSPFFADGSRNFDPTKPTPFNGEHKAGPVAMISGVDPTTKLGPLCTAPNDGTTPVSCNP